MNTNALPTRMLYTMIRVGNLDHSIDFYQNALGMCEMKRENFSEGRFTLVFMGYESNNSNTLLELTYNWDENHYEQGTAYGHLALEVTDIYAACSRLNQMGIAIIRAPGPMNHPVDETGNRELIAFIEDPDGYKIELVAAATTNNSIQGPR